MSLSVQDELTEYLATENLLPPEHLETLRQLTPLEFTFGVQTHLAGYAGREAEALLPLLQQLKVQLSLEGIPILKKEQARKLISFLIRLLR